MGPPVRQAELARRLSLVSHELRTPLASVTGYVEELRSEQVGPLNDRQRQFLEVVARNVERMQRLLDDLDSGAA